MNDTQAIIEGFITEDAVLEKTKKTGKYFTMFSMAIPHYKRPGEPGRVSFIEVEIWEQLACDNVSLLKKGKKVMVTGRLRQDRWTEKDKICSRIKLFADKIKYL